MNVDNKSKKILKLPSINATLNQKLITKNNQSQFKQINNNKYQENKQNNNRIQQTIQNQQINSSNNSNKSFIIKNKKALESIFNDTDDTEGINMNCHSNEELKMQTNQFSKNVVQSILSIYSNNNINGIIRNKKSKKNIKFTNVDNNTNLNKQDKDYIIEHIELQIPQIQNEVKTNSIKSIQTIKNQINNQTIKIENLNEIIKQNQKQSFIRIPTFQSFKKKINLLLQNIYLQLFITFLTIVSLFMQDLRTIFIDSANDHYIDYVNIFFLILFFSEILMSLTVQDYSCSFFFWLDLISTFSIIMDVTILTKLLYSNKGSSQQLNIILAQSKASRAAARAVRIMKIFRLTRIVKVYKSALKTKQLNQKRQKQLKQKLKNKKKYINQETQKLNINSEGETIMLQNQNSWMSPSVRLKDFGKGSNRSFGQENNNQIFLSPNHSGFLNIVNPSKFTSNPIYQNMNFVKKSQRSNRMSKIKEQNQQGEQKLMKYQRNSFIKLTSLKKFTNNYMMSKQKAMKSRAFRTKENTSESHASSIFAQQIFQINENQDFQSNLQISMKQSNISKILTDSTIKKIIIVILIIMITMSSMDVNNFAPQNDNWDFLLSYVSKLLENPDIPISYINNLITNNIDFVNQLDSNYQIVSIQAPFKQLLHIQYQNADELRMQQIGLFQAYVNISKVMEIRPYLTLVNSNLDKSNLTDSSMDQNYISVVVSYKIYNRIDSLFSISKIIGICIIIIYLLQAFNNNITNLIVSPIEKMLQTIINPQKKLQQDQQNIQEFQQARYQTMIVQKAILKIRRLMSTIFGKVGMDLIYNQIFKTQNISARNYLKIKKKSFSIYGICKIHNFTEITETLQSDAFNFLNQVAQVIHKAVFRYGGYGVKNFNDGFLIVFNLPEGRQQEIMEQYMKSKCSKKIKNTYLNIFCDFGIFSFIKTLVRLHKEPKIIQYSKDQRIINRFGHNFRLQMNFSMGLGQSMQGIIGSQFKIDPYFLGGKIDQINKISILAKRHPNMIIVEKQLYQKLSIAMKKYFRIMQYVKLNQYDQGDTQLYAIDLDLDYISPSRNKQEKYKKNQHQPDIYLKKQLNMQFLKDATQISNYSVQDFINKKKQFKQVLRKKISDDIKRKYQMAFHSYIAGDWVDAKQLLESILKVTKSDSLTKRLYAFIVYHQFKCPKNYIQHKTIQDLEIIYQSSSS